MHKILLPPASIILYFSAVAYAESKPTIECIEPAPKAGECFCDLRSEWIQCKNKRGGLVFCKDLSNDSSDPAIINLDGSLRHLKKISAQSDWSHLPVTEKFEGDGYEVEVVYNSAPSTCPKWEEQDDGCEYTDLSAFIRIIKNGMTQTIRASGVCGT